MQQDTRQNQASSSRIYSTFMQPVRRAFTLVELLIVIAIIAILAGLGIPAVMMALRTASEFKIKANISQLDTAIESFRNEQKVIIPDHYYDVLSQTGTTADDWVDPTNANIGQILIQRYGGFLQRFAPNHREFVPDSSGVMPIVVWYTQRGQFLNPTNSMNFWLGGGLSTSKIYPLSEEIQRSGETAAAYSARMATYKPAEYYDFGGNTMKDPLAYWTATQISDLTSLYGTDVDGTPLVPKYLRSVIQPGTNRPYLYFADAIPTTAGWPGQSDLFFPYVIDGSVSPAVIKYAKVPNASPSPWMSPFLIDNGVGNVTTFATGRFQIIAAGVDEEYGLGNISAMRDDICNFAGPNRADTVEALQAWGL